MGKLHRNTIAPMKGLLIVIVISLVAVRYLFATGFLPTHDGEYHFIRFYEFGKMLAAGKLIPRWAPGLNSGYGVPLFIFFYPFPNYIGSLFHFLGSGLADSFRLTMAVGYMAAVIACYFWLRRVYGVFPAVLASVIGAFTPYWFVDIFVRGSVGEVLAIGFVFVSLASIAYGKKTLLAIAVAGVILSHNIMAMIFLPILTMYSWITNRSMLRFFVIGAFLSAYFWVPALVERGYVVGLNTVNFRDHFPELAQVLIPSWGTGLSGPGYALDEMSYQIGLVPLLVFSASVWGRLGFFFIATAISLFLILPISLPVWERVSFLANLQYPWRLLSVVIIATPILAARLVSRLPKAVSVLLAGLAIIASFSYTKPVLYAPRPDEYYLSRREFTDGTSSLGDGFSTRWMVWQPDRPKARMEIVSGEGAVTMKEEGVTTFVGEVNTVRDAVVRTNVAYYPGWRAVLDGKSMPVEPDSIGAISVPIPNGTHRLTVYFRETFLRTVVNGISVLGLFWLLSSFILKKVYEHSH
ncbi:YfhO family protein [Candidatus Gottesmanbacteria bacterium]|nr:YfhO family protein [Candidatus Gottesmanbacteria bacterium]